MRAKFSGNLETGNAVVSYNKCHTFYPFILISRGMQKFHPNTDAEDSGDSNVGQPLGPELVEPEPVASQPTDTPESAPDLLADAPAMPTPALRPPKKPARDSHASQVLVRLVWLMSVLLILLVLRHVVPDMAEQFYHSANRGRLRAEYETAGEVLEKNPWYALTLASQQVSQRALPSVVHIQTSDINPAERNIEHVPFGQEAHGQGSGVIVDDAGYIVTNWHVVRGSPELQQALRHQESALNRQLTPAEVVGILNEHQEIVVRLSDDRKTSATIVGFDKQTDLAVLMIPAGDLLPAKWGNSDELDVGSLVWAVGSPFGLQQSVTSGILSAKNRAEKAGTAYQDFLQTDAAVNPGNSGGPLVDHRGHIVGINTAIVGDTYQGICFAIPSNVAQDVYNEIRSKGHVERGWLGIQMGEIDEQRAQELGLPAGTGVFVDSVLGNPQMQSPAYAAGIQVGDVVVRWNDIVIDKPFTLSRAVAGTEIGSSVKVELIRDGQQVIVQVVVGQRPAPLN